MFAGEAVVRPPALLLHRDGVRALLHDGVSLLDVLLAGPQGGESQLVLCSAPSVPQPVVQSQRRPLLGPSPGCRRLLALSHLRHF